MNFLITGGAGFIGSNCVKFLLNKGHAVRILDNFSTGKKENISEFKDRIEFIYAPVEDYERTRRAVEDMDYIIHLAAIPSVQFSIENPLKANKSMITATLTLFKAAAEYGKIRRVVQAASAAAYGDNPLLPKTEDMPADPLSPYAAAKLGQELYGKVFSDIYGLKVTSLRFFNVYGPKQDPKSPYSGVISIFLSRILAGEQPVIYGDGSNTRDFVYVSDVADAIYKACMARWTGRSEVINIGTGYQTSLNELICVINKVLGSQIMPLHVENRPGDILHSVADITKARSILGYQPKTTISEGMRKLVVYNEVHEANMDINDANYSLKKRA